MIRSRPVTRALDGKMPLAGKLKTAAETAAATASIQRTTTAHALSRPFSRRENSDGSMVVTCSFEGDHDSLHDFRGPTDRPASCERCRTPNAGIRFPPRVYGRFGDLLAGDPAVL